MPETNMLLHAHYNSILKRGEGFRDDGGGSRVGSHTGWEVGPQKLPQVPGNPPVLSPWDTVKIFQKPGKL